MCDLSFIAPCWSYLSLFIYFTSSRWSWCVIYPTLLSVDPTWVSLYISALLSCIIIMVTCWGGSQGLIYSSPPHPLPSNRGIHPLRRGYTPPPFSWWNFEEQLVMKERGWIISLCNIIPLYKRSMWGGGSHYTRGLVGEFLYGCSNQRRGGVGASRDRKSVG